MHTTIVVTGKKHVVFITMRRRPNNAKLGTSEINTPENHNIDILRESLAWNTNILKSLMNKRNSVPFHPCSTVTNQREVAVQIVFVKGFLNKIHNKIQWSSGTGTVTES